MLPLRIRHDVYIAYPIYELYSSGLQTEATTGQLIDHIKTKYTKNDEGDNIAFKQYIIMDL